MYMAGCILNCVFPTFIFLFGLLDYLWNILNITKLYGTFPITFPKLIYLYCLFLFD